MDESFGLISLFDDVDKLEKKKGSRRPLTPFGNNLVSLPLRANALEEASRSLARSKLIGGHSAGGLDGLKWLIVLIYPFNPREIIKIQVCRSGWDFYLSEHTSSLSEEKIRVDFSTDLTPVEKLHLLSQLYVGQLKGMLLWSRKRSRKPLSSVWWSELSPQTLSIRTNEGYRLIEVADILEIRLWEEGVYD